MKKRVFMFLSTLAILICLLPAALAASAGGTCGGEGDGGGLHWSFDNGTLTISGSGPMADYAAAEEAPWYPYRGEIRRVELSDGLTHVGSYAFSGGYGSYLPDLPESLRSIGDYAFADNYFRQEGDKSFALPRDLTTIGAHAFDDSGLAFWDQEIIIPDSVITIGDYAFFKHGFSNCTLRLGGSLTSIGSYAFAATGSGSNFTGELIIPDSVTHLGQYAFSGSLDGLTSLVLGSQLSLIDQYVFSGCHIAGQLVIPETVDTVAYAAFNGAVIDGGLVIRSPETKLQAYAFYQLHAGGLTLPQGITEIPSLTFAQCTITGDLVIPGSVTAIHANAFSDAFDTGTFTGRLILNEGLEVIEDNAFQSCGFTGPLALPDTLTSIGSSAFQNCGFTGELVIPHQVAAIGASAFRGCDFTGTLTLGKGLETIGGSAFSGCGFTGALTVPDSVTSIGSSAFSGCGFTGTLDLGDGPESIASSAFANCGFTGSLTIPDGVRTIGDNAFYGCAGFTGDLRLGTGLSSLGVNAFCDCGFTGSLIMGDSLTSIKSGAFDGCPFTGDLRLSGGLGSLSESKLLSMGINPSAYSLGFTGDLTLGEGITWVEPGLFAECRSLTGTLTLPDSLQTVDDRTFWNCGFTGLELGDGVVTIGTEAFALCSGLTGPLVIPDSTEVIGNRAFADCSFSGALTLGSGLRRIGDSAFGDTNPFTGPLSLPDGLEEIGSNAFSGMSGLGFDLDLPAGLTAIGNGAFWDTDIRQVFFSGAAPSGTGYRTFPEGAQLYAYRSADGWDPPEWNGYPLSYIAAPIGGAENPLYISLGIPYQVPGYYEPENAVHRVRVLFHAGLAEEDYAYVPMQIPWGWELFSRPADRSDSYDNRLAIAGLALSGAAEHDSSLRLSQMLLSLGFEDWNSYHYTPGEFTPLQVRHMIASKDVVMGGRPCTIFTVVCSGTLPSQLEDLISDFIPGGFNRAAEDVRDNLLAYVKDHYGVSDVDDLQDKNMRFFFTGHSLGGAVTNLLAREMAETGLADTRNMYVYTFASPLTTNGKEQLFNIHNIINADDGIPRLSPKLCPQRLGTDHILNRQSSTTVQNRTETAFRLLTGGSLNGKSLNEIMASSPLEAASILHSAIVLLTLPEKIVKFFAAHDTTTYMALLLSDVPSYDLWEYGIGSMATFQCPVDLSVYNSAGELVGQTVNNQVNTNVYADVLIQVEETEDGDFVKYVYMPFDDEYTFVVNATGTGTLTYTVEEGGHASTFANISLTNGKTFSTQAGGQLPAEVTQVFVTEGDSFKAEVDHNGTETSITGDIPVNYVTGAPAGFTRGETVALTGTLHPSAAARKDVTWTLTDAGGTGAVLTGNSLTASAPGTLTLTAAVTGSDYTQTFTVEVWDYPSLMQPYGLKWEGTVARWTALEGAAGYEVQLYRDEAALGQPAAVGANTTYVDFTQAIGTAEGSYTFTVTALGDGRTSSDSEPSWPVEAPYQVKALEADVSDGTVTVQVLRPDVPDGALLIAARYDGGRMTAAAVSTAQSGGSYTLNLAGGGGTEYRVFLLDAQRRPLCSALRQQN